MDGRREPREDTYDVVVIGSGLGGLSAAGLLARAGMKVLVVDRQDGPGGCAHAFQRGPYTFDPAIHVMGQGKDGQLVDTLLRRLGVRDRCTLLPIDPFYCALFPDYSIAPPTGLENWGEAHVERFPQEAEGIRRYVRLCAEIHEQAHDLPMQLPLHELDQAVERFPILFRYLKATLADLLDDCVSDPRAKAVLSGNWAYLGLAPSRLSAVAHAQLMATYSDGLYYCQGGFQELASALAEGLEKQGGELVFETQVSRILVEEGQAKGVALENGQEIRARLVVSNADARETLEGLVGVEHLPAPYVRRLTRMTQGLSGFVIFTATTMDVTPYIQAHETFMHKHWDHDQTYQDILEARPGGMWINVPTIVDPSLAPPGEHLVIVSALARYDVEEGWEQAKDRYTTMLLDEAEAVLPGFREQITYMDAATPVTLERFTLNYHGAAYGWDHIPSQIGSKRLGNMTPIRGLFLSGHWTQPGGGSLRVLASGVQTSAMIFATSGQPELALSF